MNENLFTVKKKSKKDYDGLIAIKLAMLGDTSTQFLTEALRGIGYEHGFNLEIWEADFDQIERQIHDVHSDLYAFEPEIIVVFQASHKLLQKFNNSKAGQHSLFAELECNSIELAYSSIADISKAKVIYFNYPEIDDSVYGSYANKVESSFLFQLRKLNFELMRVAVEKPNLYICDISTIQNQLGKSSVFKPSIYVNTEMVFSIEVLPLIASRTMDIVSALSGKFKKCLIVDLDNTVWGGVIGDDGLENIQIGSLGIGKAFTEFQWWIKKLKDRGIILAVCSKNTESVAKEPFEKHPDMVLRLDDFAVFRANWEVKSDNIRQIQSILNIGFDSMVFLDDNPFERNIVRDNIPDICVPELPEDPVNYLEYLYGLNIFEATATSTNEDKDRTRLYQVEAERVKEFKKYTNENEFLAKLEMVSAVEPFNKFNIPRVAQLSQRSNQFNLRTVRYSETEILEMANSEHYGTFAFSLDDKFGANGLICVVILHKENGDELFIDTWFMSCRVLKRGMENFVLNTIVEYGRENGYKCLRGEYLPTAKNQIVKNHYPDLGFRKIDSLFYLQLSDYRSRENYIKLQE